MDSPGWDSLIAYVRPGDTLVVTELSRMTRSLLNLLETTKYSKNDRLIWSPCGKSIDTSPVTGRCFLSMMGAIHQMERELRAERASAKALARISHKKSGQVL